MLKPGSPQVAEDLGGVLIGQLADSLQFDDQFISNEQIREEVPEQRFVLVVNGQRMLLSDIQAQFTQPISQRVLIYFFTVPVPEKTMGCQGVSAHSSAKLMNFGFVHNPSLMSFLSLMWPF